nr:hypothetical protein [Neorhizobium tomejilense]
MQTFYFDVIATGLDHQADDFEDRFYRSGCDDALVSYVGGQIRFSFAREAPSLDVAIVSATDNVASAGAKVIRIDRDVEATA